MWIDEPAEVLEYAVELMLTQIEAEQDAAKEARRRE